MRGQNQRRGRLSQCLVQRRVHVATPSQSRSASRARSDAELTEQNDISVSDAGNSQQKQPGDNNVEKPEGGETLAIRIL